MLVNERPLLVGMTLVANRIPARQGPHLTDGRGPMRVMAVNALHQTLVDAVVIGFGKIRFGRGMASVAQLGLALDEQVLFFFGVMGGVAIETSNIAAGVGGFGKMRLLVAVAVASQAASAGLLPRRVLERKYLGFVSAASHVVRPGTMAALATLMRGAALLI